MRCSLSVKARLVVLVSGTGSNLQAVMDACRKGELDAEVAAVFSDRKAAYGLTRADQAGIPSVCHPWKPYQVQRKTRSDYDADLAAAVAGYKPDYVVLAGWMRLLSASFLTHFPMRVINLHPALPGTFPGTHAIERAFNACRAGKIESTGVMVHYVPDEGVDNGPMIEKEVVPIYPDDTLETLENRIHQTEHKLLVAALYKLLKQDSEKNKEKTNANSTFFSL